MEEMLRNAVRVVWVLSVDVAIDSKEGNLRDRTATAYWVNLILGGSKGYLSGMRISSLNTPPW